jgi:hypothetical protein
VGNGVAEAKSSRECEAREHEKDFWASKRVSHLKEKVFGVVM